MSKAVVFLKMIKFEHSIFALPFAYVGAMIASQGFPSGAQVFWITVAMVGARSLAMALNRLIDRAIDAKNPRTAGRALVTGQLLPKDVVIFALVSLIVFYLAAYNLTPLCRYLAPLFVIPFVVYPYTKRFTWACHLVLGVSLGLAPIGAWIAVTNSISIIPIILGVSVAFWVAGFDIIYACQDFEVDLEQRLHSLPAKIGIGPALKVVAAFHVISVALLLVAGRMANLSIIHYLGIFVVSILLFYEDSLVKPDDLSKLNTAFFTLNGAISVVVFIFVALNYAL